MKYTTEVTIELPREQVIPLFDSTENLYKWQEGLQQMGDKCRVLVQGAAEGYKPRELTRLLGWPADWNKKASDDLRECRRQLKRLLEDSGLESTELLDHFGS